MRGELDACCLTGSAARASPTAPLATIQSYTDSIEQLVNHAGASTVAELDRRAVEAYSTTPHRRPAPTPTAKLFFPTGMGSGRSAGG